MLIRRKVRGGRGQNKESAVWLGPGKIVAIESTKDNPEGDRFGFMTHVAYKGRLWDCAAEQLQPLHPTAKAARKSPEDHEQLRKYVERKPTATGMDIRAEAPLPGEEIDPPPAEVPEEGLQVPKGLDLGPEVQEEVEMAPEEPPPESERGIVLCRTRLPRTTRNHQGPDRLRKGLRSPYLKNRRHPTRKCFP